MSLHERLALLDSVGRTQAELLGSQAEAARAQAAHSAELAAALSESREQVEALALRAASSCRLLAVRDETWLLQRSFFKLRGASPAPREGAQLAALPSHHSHGAEGSSEEAAPLGGALLLCGGGECSGVVCDEIFALDLSALAWSRLPPPLEDGAPCGPGRTGHAAVPLQTAGAVLLLCGRGGNGSSASQPGLILAPHTPSGGQPQPPHWAAMRLHVHGPPGAGALLQREGASAAAAQASGRVFVFGGRSSTSSASAGAPRYRAGAELLACLDCRDPHAPVVERLPGLAPGAAPHTHAHCAPPPPRTHAALAVDEAGRRLWLYGGTGAPAAGKPGSALRDLYSFDLAAGAWAAREPAAPPGPKSAPAATGPGRRASACAAFAGPFFLLAGGQGGGDADVWALHTEGLTWHRLASGSPPPHAASLLSPACSFSPCAFSSDGRLHFTLRSSLASGGGALDVLEVLHIARPGDGDGAPAAQPHSPHKASQPQLRLWLLRSAASSLEIAWQPPARNADRVAGFTLLAARVGSGGAGAEVVFRDPRGAADRCRVGGLRAGCEYVFALRCRYEDGTHLWSDATPFSTASARAAPAAEALSPRVGSPRTGRRRAAAALCVLEEAEGAELELEGGGQQAEGKKA